MAEGFEPSHGRINNPVPYQLGYATKELAAAARLELAHPRLQDECSLIQLSYAAIWWTGRDSNPHKKFAGLLCSPLHHQPPAFIIRHYLSFDICQFSFTESRKCPRWTKSFDKLFQMNERKMSNDKWKMIWLWVESNHQPRAYETLALIPFELHSRGRIWKPAEELNLVPFHPALAGSV